MTSKPQNQTDQKTPASNQPDQTRSPQQAQGKHGPAGDKQREPSPSVSRGKTRQQ